MKLKATVLGPFQVLPRIFHLCPVAPFIYSMLTSGLVVKILSELRAIIQLVKIPKHENANASYVMLQIRPRMMTVRL